MKSVLMTQSVPRLPLTFKGLRERERERERLTGPHGILLGASWLERWKNLMPDLGSFHVEVFLPLCVKMRAGGGGREGGEHPHEVTQATLPLSRSCHPSPPPLCPEVFGENAT